MGVQGCEGLVLYYAADSDTGNSKKNALPSNGHACVVNGHISTDDDNGGGEGLQGDGRRNRTAEDLEGDEVEREFQCFVRVHNNTTGNDLHVSLEKRSRCCYDTMDGFWRFHDGLQCVGVFFALFLFKAVPVAFDIAVAFGLAWFPRCLYLVQIGPYDAEKHSQWFLTFCTEHRLLWWHAT